MRQTNSPSCNSCQIVPHLYNKTFPNQQSKRHAAFIVFDGRLDLHLIYIPLLMCSSQHQDLHLHWRDTRLIEHTRCPVQSHRSCRFAESITTVFVTWKQLAETWCRGERGLIVHPENKTVWCRWYDGAEWSFTSSFRAIKSIGAPAPTVARTLSSFVTPDWPAARTDTSEDWTAA